MTNRFLKRENSINRFFISIIGPYTKKPRIEPKGNRFKKLRAIKASEVEQAENAKAKSIITRSEPAALPPVMLKNSCGTAARIRAVIKAPRIKKGPAVKNSEHVCISSVYSFACTHRTPPPAAASLKKSG